MANVRSTDAEDMHQGGQGIFAWPTVKDLGPGGSCGSPRSKLYVLYASMPGGVYEGCQSRL